MDILDVLAIHQGRNPNALSMSQGPIGTAPLRGMERVSVEESVAPLPDDVYEKLLQRAIGVPGVSGLQGQSERMRKLSKQGKKLPAQLDLSPAAGFVKGILGRDIGYVPPKESPDDVLMNSARIEKMIADIEGDTVSSILNGMKQGLTEKKTTVGESVKDAFRPLPRDSGSTEVKLDMKGFADRVTKSKSADEIGSLERIQERIPDIFDPNSNAPIEGYNQSFEGDNLFGIRLPDNWRKDFMLDTEEGKINRTAIEGLTATLRNGLFGATLTAGEQASWARLIGESAGQSPKALRGTMKRFRDTLREKLRIIEAGQSREANEFRKIYKNELGLPAPLHDHPVLNNSGLDGGVPSEIEPEPVDTRTPRQKRIDELRANQLRRSKKKVDRTPQGSFDEQTGNPIIDYASSRMKAWGFPAANEMMARTSLESPEGVLSAMPEMGIMPQAVDERPFDEQVLDLINNLPEQEEEYVDPAILKQQQDIFSMGRGPSSLDDIRSLIEVNHPPEPKKTRREELIDLIRSRGADPEDYKDMIDEIMKQERYYNRISNDIA